MGTANSVRENKRLTTKSKREIKFMITSAMRSQETTRRKRRKKQLDLKNSIKSMR